MQRKSSRLSFYVLSHPANETLDEFRYKNLQPLSDCNRCHHLPAFKID